jgi:predicted nuclease of predicted toxin-antitoxin system
VKFALDAHLPPKLAVELRAAGHDCDEVAKVLSSDAPDMEIAAFANASGAALLSKDVDFVDLLHRGILRVPLIRVRLRNMAARDTCEAVLSQLPRILASLGAGERIIEIK